MRKQCVIPSILFLRLFSAVEYLTTMRVLGTGFVDDHKISSNKSLHCGIIPISTLIKALDQSGGWKAMLYLLVYILPVNNAPFTR